MRKFVVIPGNNQAVIKKALLKRGNWEDVTEENTTGDFDRIHFIWKPTNLPIRTYAKMDSKDVPFDFAQVINHFEHNNGICTKTGLIRSLKAYYYNNEQALLHRYSIFESTPTTFLITAGDENQEYTNFVARFRDITKKQFSKEHLPEKHCTENLWLIKPANMNQGRGIEILKNLKDINNFIANQTLNSYWVVQKYVEKPLLYYGRKFDIRVWVVVTHKMEIFFHKVAYMRTSSDVYNMNQFDNYIHLTNNCLQKHGENFGKFESGNTLPLDALQNYIDEMFPELNVSVNTHIVPRMKDLIIDTILSVKKQLNPKKRKNVFELFGYDFLIDEDFRTWLLEVNTNPYLGVPNDFIRNLLPEMVDDMLSIVLDPVYPPGDSEFQTGRENRFELIYCEYHSSHHDGPLNTRSQFYENIYPAPQIAPPLRHVKQGTTTNTQKDYLRENRSLVREYTQDLTSSNIFSKHAPNATNVVENLTNSMIRIKDSIIVKDKDNQPIYKRRVNSKAQTMGMLENPEKPDRNTPPSNREGERERKTPQEKAVKEKNPEAPAVVNEAAKKMENLLDTYLYLDLDAFFPLISRLLSILTNWELHGDKEIVSCCNALLKLAESKSCGALTEMDFSTQMITLLDSQNVPFNIQMTIIKMFLNICKKISEMKKIVCDKMIHALIRITVASCDPEQSQNYDTQIIKLAVQCLGALAGKYDKKMYIPGETRDFTKVRDFLINQGGVLALMAASKMALDEDVKKIPNQILNYLDEDDWESQKNVLDRLKADKRDEVPADGGESPANDKKKANMNFLFAGNSNVVTRAESRKAATDSKATGEPERTPNIPRYLLDIKSYTLDDMMQDVEDRLAKLREDKKRKEQEEGEKREQQQQEMLREMQQRELIAQEKKKKLDEHFLKRLEEKKRLQEEIAKKNEEESKQRFLLEEERKRQKIEELIRKKEEFDRKAKRMEMKKKKLEEETKKMVEEEMEKRKIQRKALEESFWLRISLKEKEKNGSEKLELGGSQPMELHARRVSNLILTPMDRTLSVETRREDSSEKSRMMKSAHFHTPQHINSRGHKLTTFEKIELGGESPLAPIENKIRRMKQPRQKSVEDLAVKKFRDEGRALPAIEIKNKTHEKFNKGLRTSNLFTLNEDAQEEDNLFGSPDQKASKLIRHFQRNSRNGSSDLKLKKIVASDDGTSSKPRNLMYVREIIMDKKSKDKNLTPKSSTISSGHNRHGTPHDLRSKKKTQL